MLASIAIVAKDEERYLDKLLNDILLQTASLKDVELLLIDSMSVDNTYQIMKEFREKYINCFNDIVIFENASKTQSSGWNIAIKEFKGDTLTRIDGHSSLDSDFMKNILLEIDNGEDVVGGPRNSIVENDSKWSKLLYFSESSMFGSGIASYRKETKKDCYKKTMFHATYKRSVIEKVGFFNEELGRTEDNDFHFRIRKSGYKLFYTNRIKSFQYIRPTLCKMVKQKYSNGFWIGKTLIIQPQCLSIFHFIPGLFVLSLMVSLLLFNISHLLFYTIIFSYLFFCLLSMCVEIIRNKSIIFLLLPCIFVLLHVSYGMGTIIGIFASIVGGKYDFTRKKT